jgi:predicted DNA-binding transcriptional regulator AlpA
MPTKPDRLIGSDEVAARLNLHRDTVVKRARSDPRFPKPTRYTPGGRLTWRESDIDKFIEQLSKRA